MGPGSPLGRLQPWADMQNYCISNARKDDHHFQTLPVHQTHNRIIISTYPRQQTLQGGLFPANTVTMIFMKKKYAFISWRLKLILLLGCFGGVGVALFGIYVESISDLPVGPTPLSWRFKSSSARVATLFSKGENNMEETALKNPHIPEIDKAVSGETELALFALG